jgi:4-hydroxybenzoate polyprenyltransferase
MGVFYYPWFVSIGLLFTSHGVPEPIIALNSYGVMISIFIFVYALNDIMDADLDKYSSIKSKRPIPSGKMTKRQALFLSAVGGIVGFVLSFTINSYATMLAIIYMGMGFAYSVPPIRFKRRPLMKETTLTIGTIVSVLLGSAAAGGIPISIFLPGLFFVLGGMTIYPVFYDPLDIKEDRREGCKTIGTILDQKKRLELSTFGLLTIMVTTTLTYRYFDLNIICPIIVVFGGLLFLRYIFPLLMKPEEAYKQEVVRKTVSICRGVAFIIPLGFILGALQL